MHVDRRDDEKPAKRLAKEVQRQRDHRPGNENTRQQGQQMNGEGQLGAVQDRPPLLNTFARSILVLETKREFLKAKAIEQEIAHGRRPQQIREFHVPLVLQASADGTVRLV